MASSSVTISCDRGTIRTFGGNRSQVKSVANYYSTISINDFFNKHPYLTEEDYFSLKISKKFNKK